MDERIIELAKVMTFICAMWLENSYIFLKQQPFLFLKELSWVGMHMAILAALIIPRALGNLPYGRNNMLESAFEGFNSLTLANHRELELQLRLVLELGWDSLWVIVNQQVQ